MGYWPTPAARTVRREAAEALSAPALLEDVNLMGAPVFLVTSPLARPVLSG